VSTPLNTNKRAVCARCLRAMRACICGCVRQVESEIEVLILQHPAEVNHVKGSATLLHLCLPRSAILVGERFAEEDLHPFFAEQQRTNVLLYPDFEGTGSPTMQSFPAGEKQRIRLILLDASWRHSKQMLMHSPSLQTIPRYALHQTPPSRYQIRHAYTQEQLSTLEACTYALMQLESPHDKFNALLQAFDAFNDLQISFGANKLLRTKK
jgi:DTW domain-containing protein YfiP